PTVLLSPAATEMMNPTDILAPTGTPPLPPTPITPENTGTAIAIFNATQQAIFDATITGPGPQIDNSGGTPAMFAPTEAVAAVAPTEAPPLPTAIPTIAPTTAPTEAPTEPPTAEPAAPTEAPTLTPEP